MEIFQAYPAELRTKERAAILERRRVAGQPAPSSTGRSLPTDTIGLALSGGGIRSATFNLGVLQALARNKVLRCVDVMSTISGGGYIGSFVGRFFDRLRNWPGRAVDLVEGALVDPQSPEIQWLRRHGNYIAPSGKADMQVNLAVLLRNLLTLHFVMGLLVFVVFGFANLIRYKFLEQGSAALHYVAAFNWSEMPIGRLVTATGLTVFWSPWFMLCELLVLTCVIPYALGYWLASQEEPERYCWPPLTANFLVMATLLYLGVKDGLNTAALLGAVPFIVALGVVENTWRMVRRVNAAVGTGGKSVERLRARNYLTRDLSLWLALAGSCLIFALIDTGAHAIYEAYLRHNRSYLTALAQIGGGLAALLPVLQFIARNVSHRQSKRENPTSLTRWLAIPAVSGLIATVLLAPPLLFVSLLSHVAYSGGDTWMLGLKLTLGALVLSAIFAVPKAIPLINRSSLNQTYAARLARAYLGASNPLRFASRGQAGRNIDEVMPDDDTDSLQSYQPFAAGGPLHIIGTCVNETVDQVTQQEPKDRQGTLMAVSSVGMSIGCYWHALWDGTNVVRVVGYAPGTAHPLVNAKGDTVGRVEDLKLRQWISISGAAFGSGMGQHTNKLTSLLFTLGNLRTGYWFDSGLSSAHRGIRPEVSFLRRLLWLLPRLFVTQSCLLDEATGRFAGPWSRFWYLSDGGHFENLGAYELIRRRIPFMVVTDASADADYDFDDFANLQRKLRIDFQAELTLFTDEDWIRVIARRAGSSPAARDEWLNYFAPVRQHLGRPGPRGEAFYELTPQRGRDEINEPAKKCAALFKVTYQDGSQPSLLLYLKACLVGDESPDVREYSIANPEFPHESTADQFFDEAQWESYRQLGEHLATKLLRAGPLPANASPTLWLAFLGD